MGPPFDWRLRPKRVTQLTSSTALRPPDGLMADIARLSTMPTYYEVRPFAGGG